jgi:hypothetical protein
VLSSIVSPDLAILAMCTNLAPVIYITLKLASLNTY